MTSTSPLSRVLPFAIVCLAGCASAAAAPASPDPGPRPASEHPGCFLAVELESGERVTVGPQRCAAATVPASTFKVPHALLALELGVVTDPHATEPWDGTDYWIDDWERDHSLATALDVSAVWFFQRTAERIGRERMREGLRTLDYGNATVDGELTSFWLEAGSLRITGPEQLDFIERLGRRELSVARTHQDTVLELLVRTPQSYRGRLPDGEPLPPTRSTLRAKTGTADGVTWLVGIVEGDAGRWAFVSRVQDERPAGSESPAVQHGLRELYRRGWL